MRRVAMRRGSAATVACCGRGCWDRRCLMSRGKRSCPCQLALGTPTLHVWQPAAVAGWFTCGGCGVVGVCMGCLTARGITRPTLAVPLWCATHHATVCGKRLPLSGAWVWAGREKKAELLLLPNSPLAD